MAPPGTHGAVPREVACPGATQRGLAPAPQGLQGEQERLWGALVRCRLHDKAPAEKEEPRLGGLGWGCPPKPPPTAPSMAERSSRPWGNTNSSAQRLQGRCRGLTHSSAPAWDPAGSQGRCCLYQLPRWGAAPRGPLGTWGSSARPPSGLGESTAAARAAGGGA